MSELPCDREVFEKGEGVCVVVGNYMRSSPAVQIEAWVKEIARRASARVDWHYSGGRASVLHLGDEASRARVLAAIDETRANFEAEGGMVLSVGRPALYRAGVDHLHPDIIGVDTSGQ